jgi:DNA polymerase-3 subunit epsilon
MHAVIAHVDFKLCGSELLSLLIESSEIKHRYPLFNTAQKRKTDTWCIFNYQDKQGVQHLAYAKRQQVKRPLMRFYSIGQCRTFLEMLQESFDLCPRYLELQKSSAECFHYTLKQCKGVCAGKEEIAEYNTRVRQAIKSMCSISGSFLILLDGRNTKEFAFVLVEQGLYQGYGFVPGPKEKLVLKTLSSHLVAQHDNADVQRILRTYFRHSESQEVIELETPLERKGQQILSLF